MNKYSIPILYTVEEVADILHIGRSTAYRIIKKGELDSIKLGRNRRVPLHAMQKYVDDLVGESYYATE